MANLTTHYKEKNPEETIQNIKDFFTQNGFTLIESDVHESEAGTWYCRIELFKNDICFHGTNGKGMNRIYSLASGYAELYERFCNKMFFLNSICWTKTLMKTNKEKHGYYFNPNERILSYEELFSNYGINNYFSHISSNNDKLKKEIIDFITDGIYIGVPFSNIANNEDKIYLDPRLFIRLMRSNGMAAGNTIEEAVVQACSELMERYVSDQVIYKDLKAIIPHALKLENIKNEELQEKIQKIHDAGYDLYLIDLSYNYQMPVMMSVLINKKEGIFKINFGSFPVFDIAAERVITELYQGITSFKFNGMQAELQYPYKKATIIDIHNEYGNSISGRYFSAEFIDKIQYENTYNKKVYLDKNHDSDELINYYSHLGEKLNLKFYYINNSLSDKIYAVHVIMDMLDNKNQTYTFVNNYNFNRTQIEIQKDLKLLYDFKEIYNNLFEDKSVNLIKFISNLINLMSDPKQYLFFNFIVLWNGVFTCSRNHGSNFEVLFPLLNPINEQIKNIPIDISHSEFAFEYKKYMQLIAYVISKSYSMEEILHIFNDIFNYNITEEDVIKCTFPAYLLQRVYVEPYTKYIHSDHFKEIIKIYTENIQK